MKIAEALAQRQWYVVDAQGKVLGRMASGNREDIAWQNKPIFTPNVDAGDFVIVVNARGLKLTGKTSKKVYYRHTEYQGHPRKELQKKMLEESRRILFCWPSRGCCQRTG
jgi:large subunit ribosomal protein L13